jgi:fucose permease
VTFMMRVRSASPSVSGMCASGFWAGMAIGRIVLGFVTQRYGERLSITVYLSLAIALEVIFWLVNHISVSVVTITLLGFFLGPLFPAGVVMITSLLPRDLHVSAVASAAAVGQTGGATFPFAFGTIAQVWGVKVFQPIVFAMLLLVLLLWLLFPRLDKESEDTEASARNRNTGAIG